MLEVKALSQFYGDFRALENISFTLGEEEILGIIGQNGAGKTTLINSITGFGQKPQGEVLLDGENIAGKRADRIARMGIARTFQNLKIFKQMTVCEHLLTAENYRLGFLKKLSPFFKEAGEKRLDDLMDFFGIGAYRDTYASELSYGDCRRVEMARALAGEPKVLILDEPGAGMNEQESGILAEQIVKIRDRFHTSVILIEHDMDIIKACCERVIVLDYGRKIAEGTFSEIARNEEVRKAYLGEDDA